MPADVGPRRSDEELLAVVHARAGAVYERRQFAGIGTAVLVTFVLALIVAIGGNGGVAAQRTVRAAASSPETTTTTVADTPSTDAPVVTPVEASTPTTTTAPSSAPTTTPRTVPRSAVTTSPPARRATPPAPQALVVEVWPPNRDPGRIYVSARGESSYGYISRMTLTWGDGTAARNFDFSASSCQNPGGSPVHDVEAVNDNHAYHSPGSYTVRLLVTATSCDGSTTETAASEATVTYPSSPPSV